MHLLGLTKKNPTIIYLNQEQTPKYFNMLADTHKQSSKTIQRVLRHKNVTTTERYIQNINADLKSTMNLLSAGKIYKDHKRNAKSGQP